MKRILFIIMLIVCPSLIPDSLFTNSIATLPARIVKKTIKKTTLAPVKIAQKSMKTEIAPVTKPVKYIAIKPTKKGLKAIKFFVKLSRAPASVRKKVFSRIPHGKLVALILFLGTNGVITPIPMLHLLPPATLVMILMQLTKRIAKH